jgi:hypothetical protein
MRLHLFEFTDVRWIPDILKFHIAEIIEQIDTNSPTLEVAFDKLETVLEQQGEKDVTELCAGSGRTVIRSLKDAFARGRLNRLRITDYFPQVREYRKLAREYPFVDVVERPVDARQVPEDLPGARIIIRGFHHFAPDDAKAILKSAYDRRRVFAVFETPERSARWMLFISLIPSFILALIMTARIRPFRWHHLVFGYLIPIVPLMFCWDNVVSGLRAYTQKELNGLVADFSAPDYRWEIGVLRNKDPKHAIKRIHYLIGESVKEAAPRVSGTVRALGASSAKVAATA